MPHSEHAVENEALRLPKPERVRLVTRLLDSLEERPGGEPQSVQTAWIKEANRRYEAYVRGEEDAVPAERFFEELRAEDD